MNARRPPLSGSDAVLYRILSDIGIADQLLTTRFNRTMAKTGLSMPQFAILSHMSRDPERPRTVGSIASAFQAPQPGITKMLAKLRRRGWLRMQPAPDDARARHVFITAEGLAAFAAALKMLTPDARLIFAGWSAREIAQLNTLLRRFTLWLDENRDTKA